MISSSILKESYEVEVRNGAFYTGGRIRWSQSGEFIFCSSTEAINIVNVATGKVESTFQTEENDTVLCFAIDSDGKVLVSCHRSGLLKSWNTHDKKITKQWKSIHKGPIAEVELTKDGNLLITGGSDSIIRIWDVNHHSCILALRGIQGVVSALMVSEKFVIGCGDDFAIHMWNISTGELLKKFTGHYSKVTSFTIPQSRKYLVSCGRDKVIIIWDLETGETLKTLPIYEPLEGVVELPNKFELPKRGEVPSGDYIAAIGEKGIIRIIDVPLGREFFTQNDSVIQQSSQGLTATQLLCNVEQNLLAVTTFDHNIIFYELNSFKCKKQLIGFSDEILDLALIGPSDSHVVVASNSCDLKLYNLSHQGCQLLRGHTDFVLALASSYLNTNLLLSSGKDFTVRLWEFNPATESMTCVSVGTRHTSAVSALAFCQLVDNVFCSGGSDTTLKLWKREEDNVITVVSTVVAHAKDVNFITFSPNDKIIATASQDKYAKLWNASDLSLLGVLSGHRRGVWCVKFSPIDQIVLTSSADCTIKLWSIADLSCLKTLEGHESSVLQAYFISRGMQIISASGDGLLKLWTIKNSECVGTFDGHLDKIWAMAVSRSEERLVTGGTDSLLLIWKDVTEIKRMEKIQARDEMLLKEQTLKNLLQEDNLLAALELSLDLDRPFQVLKITKSLINRGESDGLSKTISKLSTDHKEKMLKCASGWNLNAKHCMSAQKVISVLLDDIAINKLVIPNLSSYVEELLPYTERHFRRLSNVLQELHLLQYTCELMKPTFANT